MEMFCSGNGVIDVIRARAMINDGFKIGQGQSVTMYPRFHYPCECYECYSGPKCETALGCKNGGNIVTKTVPTHRQVCQCQQFYSGHCCEVKSCAAGSILIHGKCQYAKCENGGEMDGNGRCICGPYFYGKFCEKVVCVNGGKFRSGGCVCPDDTTRGKHCEELNCRNGGTYVASSNSCDCPSGYRGLLCETENSAMIFGIAGGAILLLVLAILIYRRYCQKQRHWRYSQEPMSPVAAVNEAENTTEFRPSGPPPTTTVDIDIPEESTHTPTAVIYEGEPPPYEDDPPPYEEAVKAMPRTAG